MRIHYFASVRVSVYLLISELLLLLFDSRFRFDGGDDDLKVLLFLIFFCSFIWIQHSLINSIILCKSNVIFLLCVCVSVCTYSNFVCCNEFSLIIYQGLRSTSSCLFSFFCLSILQPHAYNILFYSFINQVYISLFHLSTYLFNLSQLNLF